jgi:hypothetical protein
MKNLKNVLVCDIFIHPPVFDLMFVAEAVGAGAALRYGSGSTKMMRLLTTPAPQN